MWMRERQCRICESAWRNREKWRVRVLGFCGLMLVWAWGGCESSQVAGTRAADSAASPRPTVTATTRTALAATSPAACQFPGPWTREVPDPVQSTAGGALTPLNITADPSVIYENNRFRMWFTTGDSKKRTGIAYAESTDGKRWTMWKRGDRSADSLADLVVASTSNGWDAPGIENAAVLRLPSGGYRMYYTGNRPPEGSNAYAIGLATSDDAITWRKHGQLRSSKGPTPGNCPSAPTPRTHRHAGMAVRWSPASSMMPRRGSTRCGMPPSG